MKKFPVFCAGLFFIALVSACGEPNWMIPGGKLSGTVVAAPGEWTNVPDTIQIETNPAAPYSVNIWAAGVGNKLYVATSNRSKWPEYIAADSNVRARVDGKLYELKATLVTDPDEIQQVLKRYIEKYEVDAQGSFVEEGKVFRFESPGT